MSSLTTTETACCGPVDCGHGIRDLFGADYIIGCENSQFIRGECGWHDFIVCRYGTIEMSGNGWLWCTATGARKAINELAEAHPDKVIIQQDGDDGISFEVRIEDCELAFSVLKPKRRKRK
jgi:hypothetical protein